MSSCRYLLSPIVCWTISLLTFQDSLSKHIILDGKCSYTIVYVDFAYDRLWWPDMWDSIHRRHMASKILGLVTKQHYHQKHCQIITSLCSHAALILGCAQHLIVYSTQVQYISELKFSIWYFLVLWTKN